VVQDVSSWLLRLVRDEPPPVGEVPAASWPALLEAAREADVEPLLAQRLLAAPQPPPAAFLPRLRDSVELARKRTALFVGEADRAVRALAAAGIEAVVLKGVGLAPALYDPPETRAFRDIDLLVRPSQVDRALEVLGRLGYRSACGGEAVELLRRHHFHLPLEADGRPPLELHWSLARPGDPYRLDAATLLEGACRDGAVPRPGPEAQLLHVAVSELRVGFTDLKRLVDFDRVVRSRAPIDWNRVAARAAASTSHRPCA